MRQHRLGWHILRVSRKLGFNDGRLVRVGVRMRMKRFREPIAICHNGMHASPTLPAAFNCAQQIGILLQTVYACRVEIENVVTSVDESDVPVWNDQSKFVGEYRRVLWMVPLSAPLNGWYCDPENAGIHFRKRVLLARRQQLDKAKRLGYVASTSKTKRKKERGR